MAKRQNRRPHALELQALNGLSFPLTAYPGPFSVEINNPNGFTQASSRSSTALGVGPSIPSHLDPLGGEGESHEKSRR